MHRSCYDVVSPRAPASLRLSVLHYWMILLFILLIQPVVTVTTRHAIIANTKDVDTCASAATATATATATSDKAVPQIILDCDPAGLIATGLDVDDDLALLNSLSLHQNGEITVLGITVTGGNAPIEFTFPNALEMVRRRAGISEDEIGIYRGGNSLFKSKKRGKNEKGEHTSDAAGFIIHTIMTSPVNSVTMLCIGPLENLATAYMLEPRIADRLQRVVIMGGTLTRGLPYDLNIRTNPQAAAIVLNEMNCPKVLLPVETCIQAAFGPTQLARVREHCQDNPETVVCSLEFRLAAQRRIMPWLVNWRYSTKPMPATIARHFSDGFILWDLAALWAAVLPNLYEDWTYFDVEVSPGQSGLGGKGPEMLFDPVVPTKKNIGNDTDHRNLVLVPLTLKNESVFQALFLDHLLYQAPSNPDWALIEPILSFRESLGSLPRICVSTLCILSGLVASMYGIRRKNAWEVKRSSKQVHDDPPP